MADSAPEGFFKLKHSPIVLLIDCQWNRIFGILWGKKKKKKSWKIELSELPIINTRKQNCSVFGRKPDYIGMQCYDDETLFTGKFITWILHSIC